MCCISGNLGYNAIGVIQELGNRVLGLQASCLCHVVMLASVVLLVWPSLFAGCYRCPDPQTVLRTKKKKGPIC